MKAILVIDMPKNCAKCKLQYLQGVGEAICNAVDWDERPSWCSLKPMPTKKKPLFDPDHCEIEKEIKIVHEIIGYNRCIDEIMGETDDETVKSA